MIGAGACQRRATAARGARKSMNAVTVRPGVAGSARLEQLPEPDTQEGAVLVETVAVGVCGTDREILSGLYGAPPPGTERLVLGHESLGRVLDAPQDSGFRSGDLVVGVVRRPDPVPCEACAVGEWDMCCNGRYTEHGIKGLDGFCRERFRVPVASLVPIDRVVGLRGVLLEPASIVAKAWDQIDRIGARSRWTPRRVLVLGAGPVGLLAALFAVLRRLEVHVLDRVKTGPKPAIVASLGAEYHTGAAGEACGNVDIVLECTGAPSLVFDAMRCVAPNGIVCLTGVSSGGRILSVDAGALNNELVLENNVVFGTVNANRLHYGQAAEALAKADQSWLERVITRRVAIERWQDAYAPQPDDVKTVLQFAAV
jgi:threonine dehydrogenase-like Zn-dependent dehydrogenase